MESAEYQKKVEAGLEKQVADGIKANFSGGLLFILLGILTFLLVFGFIYFGVGVALGWLVSIPSWIRTTLGLAAIGALWYLHTQNPILRTDTFNVTLPESADPFTWEIPHSSWNRQIELLMPYQRRNPQVLAKSVLLFAPQLIAAGKECLRRSVRMKEIDLKKAGRIIAMMLGKTKIVYFAEIHTFFPQGESLQIIAQLADIEGVELLPGSDLSLSLSPQLRQDLLAEFYD